MYILHDLWDGGLNPSADNCPADEQYRAARKQLLEQEELFWAELSPAGKRAYEACQNVRAHMICQEERNAFVQGFRLGARLLLDVLTEDGQQKRP